jgi:hypothetical protein
MRDFHGVYKAALDLQGYDGGPCRASLVTPDATPSTRSRRV